MRAIPAISENGGFRPIEPVDRPDGCPVSVEPRPVAEPEGLSPHQRRIYERLRQPVSTGDPRFSERHDEYQP